jgi:hypothetical protein
MSVEIDPPEQLEFNRTLLPPSPEHLSVVHTLTFPGVGPFTQQVARYLKVRNTNDTAVAYKVKTTAPRRYRLLISLSKYIILTPQLLRPTEQWTN